MKIRYEMQRRSPEAGQYDPPAEMYAMEINTHLVTEAVDTFNDFLLSIWGGGWQVDFVEDGDDESDDD